MESVCIASVPEGVGVLLFLVELAEVLVNLRRRNHPGMARAFS